MGTAWKTSDWLVVLSSIFFFWISLPTEKGCYFLSVLALGDGQQSQGKAGGASRGGPVFHEAVSRIILSVALMLTHCVIKHLVISWSWQLDMI